MLKHAGCALVLLVTSGFSGCSSTTENYGVADAGPGFEATDPALLVGEWFAECYISTVDWDYSPIMRFADATHTSIELDYHATGDGCSNRTSFKDLYTRTYVFGGETTAGSGIRMLDYTLVRIERTLNVAAMVDEANTTALYGYTDWEVASPKDITGRLFSTTSTSPAPSAGEQTFTIYQPTWDGEWNAQFGKSTDGHEGTSGTTRHDTLGSIVYNKL